MKYVRYVIIHRAILKYMKRIINEALTEDRPYKKGLSHEKTCEMLDDMAQKGFVDSDISKKIRECFGRI